MLKAAMLAMLMALTHAGLVLAQSNPLYVPLSPAKAVFYKPDAGPAPRVGIVVMHRVANYLSHVSCTEFSRRGFAVLCMNSRFDNNEVRVVWEQIALDVKAGVEYLKRQPGITKVVLFGHSGGAPTMSFYQAVAENGVAYCQNLKRLTHCGNELAGLPRADGIVFADAHPGFPMTILRGFNPSILDEKDPTKIDASLDPFDPKNGYNPKGESRYSAEFQKRYFEGQSTRMNKLIDSAVILREKMKRGGHYYKDNDIVVIARGGNPVGGPGGVASLHVLQPPSKPSWQRHARKN
ncbi:MAG: alpha/beta hydrolase family protein [Burkholderiales bacterium]